MINFQNIKAGFHLENPAFFRNWLKQVIKNESTKKTGEINYIFCGDDYLLNINQTYLKHDTFTDIITFPLTGTDENVISGEIYISIDRVKENADQYGKQYFDELSRVMVHGLLHLLGYDDQTAKEKSVMRQKEDYYLTLQLPKNS